MTALNSNRKQKTALNSEIQSGTSIAHWKLLSALKKTSSQASPIKNFFIKKASRKNPIYESLIKEYLVFKYAQVKVGELVVPYLLS
jgi:hypothetical protein